jgi:hypothetical protein
MANEFIARNGLISQNNSVVTGSLTVTQGITGSLFGTSSWATNALISSFITGSTNAFIQGGNSFGATALLGTNDNQSLALETSGSTRMFISSSGNVGIGTTTPAAPLHVVFDGSVTAGINVDSTVNTVNHISFLRNGVVYGRFGVNASTGEFRWDSPTSYFPTIYSSGVERMRINTSGNVGISTTTPAARLDVSGSVNISGSGVQVPLQVYSGSTPLLFVSQSGNVGIGTSTPTTKFDIVDSNNIPTLRISNPGGGGFGGGGNIDIVGGASDYVEGQISWKNGATTRAFIGYPSAARTLTLSSEQIIDFQTNGGSKMYLDSSGNLGIGKTPTTKLDVSGSVNITGSLNVTQGITGSLFGTSSWATNSLTSSFVTGSNVFGPFGSNSIISSSFAVSSSFATTASFASNGGVTSIVAGTNITISSATGNVTISSTGGGGGGGTDLGLVQAMTVGLQNIF